MYFAVSTKEPLRYERVALAYHGFNLLEFVRRLLTHANRDCC